MARLALPISSVVDTVSLLTSLSSLTIVSPSAPIEIARFRNAFLCTSIPAPVSTRLNPTFAARIPPVTIAAFCSVKKLFLRLLIDDPTPLALPFRRSKDLPTFDSSLSEEFAPFVDIFISTFSDIFYLLRSLC